MGKFVIKRLGISLVVILLISIFSFSLVHMLPGDPAVLALGSEASETDVENFREKYNLNKPVVEQYFLWMKGMLHGDLGDSIAYSRPVLSCLAERLPRTVSIGLPALIISSILGILAGIISAIHRGKFVDNLITFISTIGLGAPQFWLGIVGIWFFGMKLGWLPLSGYVAPSENFGQYVYDPDSVVQPAGFCRKTDTFQHAGSRQPGLYPHRPCGRPRRTQRYLQACLKKCVDSGYYNYRHAGSRGCRRLVDGGAGFQYRGYRYFAGQCSKRPRLYGCAGLCIYDFVGHCRRQLLD